MSSQIPTNENHDPFDPRALRLDPNQSLGPIGVKRKFATIRVGKPNKQEFVRVHPSPDFRLECALIEDKVNSETYVVAPAMVPQLPDFVIPARICFAVTRHGVPFLWPARLPDPNGRPMDWHTSALEAQALAIDSWCRIQADMSAGSYAIFQAVGNLGDPVWPDDMTFHDALKIGFRGKMLDRLDHPFVAELLGEA